MDPKVLKLFHSLKPEQQKIVLAKIEELLNLQESRGKDAPSKKGAV